MDHPNICERPVGATQGQFERGDAKQQQAAGQKL